MKNRRSNGRWSKLRADSWRLLRDREQLWSGWIAPFPAGAVPPGVKISAWAVEADDPKLYQLKQNAPE